MSKRTGNRQIIICVFLVVFFSVVTGCATDDAARKKAHAHTDVGSAYIQAGQYTAALRELLEAEKLMPGDPRVHYMLGLAYEQKGLPEEAFTQFKRAVALKPDYSEAWNWLGTVYFSRGLTDEAIECYRKALSNTLYDTPSLALYNMGEAYMKKGLFRAAYASYQEALSREPTTRMRPRIEMNMGVARISLGEPQESLKHLNKVVDEFPNFAEARYWLGTAYQKLGDKKNAAREFQTVIRMDPDSVFGAKARESLNSL
jgi:type IV pilus assembly protein PilF